MKSKLLFLLSLFLVLFITGCESKPQQAKEVQLSSEGEQAEILKADSYTLITTTADKITFDVADGVMLSPELNGKMVLFNFWATWCKPCIKEMPTFVKLQEEYKDDFMIVGVLFEKQKDRDELTSFLKKHKINFPITVGSENFVLAEAFDNVKMIPESFLYSKAGFFVDKYVGIIDEKILEDHIKESMK